MIDNNWRQANCLDFKCVITAFTPFLFLFIFLKEEILSASFSCWVVILPAETLSHPLLPCFGNVGPAEVGLVVMKEEQG